GIDEVGGQEPRQLIGGDLPLLLAEGDELRLELVSVHGAVLRGFTVHVGLGSRDGAYGQVGGRDGSGAKRDGSRVGDQASSSDGGEWRRASFSRRRAMIASWLSRWPSRSPVARAAWNSRSRRWTSTSIASIWQRCN